MRGGEDDGRDPDGGDAVDETPEGTVDETDDATATADPDPDDGPDDDPNDGADTTPDPAPPSIFDLPTADPLPAAPPPVPQGPVLPVSEPKAPIPMVDPVTQPRPGASTWYRTDEERAKSVYRRANPWYRRVARGLIAVAFLGVAAVGAYAGARAIQDYLERDRLPAAGAEVPEIRATSFIVTSAPPAPALDGTLTLDTTTQAFEFVGRATGPQSGLQVVSADGATVYVRQGAAPWRAAGDGDPAASAVVTAVRYLADDDNADDILTNRLRRGFVELVDRVEEGSGDEQLTRYEMTFDTGRLARDFPLQWQDFQDDAVPGATAADDVPVTIWLDADDVLVRVADDGSNWAWERLTYSDQAFRPLDPTADTAPIIQVACVSDDNSVFWQTPLASCDAAIAAGRDAAAAAGLTPAFDDLDRTIAVLCSTMEREDGPLPAEADEARLASELVEAGVCRGDPSIFTTG